jgi:L-fuconolactonase
MGKTEGVQTMKRRQFLWNTGVGSAALLGISEFARTESVATESILPFPIVDTHVHFWDTERLDYPWLKNSALLNRPYLPKDYDEAIGPVTVGKIIFVEAACADVHTMDEVSWVTSLAKDDSRISGIVANVPLEQGKTVLPQIEALAENPLVKGIRRFFSTEKDAPHGLLPALVEGVKCLEKVGFHFELGLQRGQIPVAVELVRQCPNIKFVLNHIGVPDIKNNDLDLWRQEMRTLAKYPNVFCKMSGVATVADHDSWTVEDLKPALDHVIECFGFERTVFGSDWPVMLLATPYQRWVKTVAAAVKGCSDPELRNLFYNTAAEFYDLD